MDPHMSWKSTACEGCHFTHPALPQLAMKPLQYITMISFEKKGEVAGGLGPPQTIDSVPIARIIQENKANSEVK